MQNQLQYSSCVESKREEFGLRNENNVLFDELFRYKLLCDCLNKYIEFLDQIRDKNSFNDQKLVETELNLKQRIVDIKSCFVCELDLNQLQINSDSNGIRICKTIGNKSKIKPKLSANTRRHEKSGSDDNRSKEQTNDCSDNEVSNEVESTPNANQIKCEFICDSPNCGKSFINREHLRYHKRIHRNKDFKCDFIGCGYSSYCRKNLVKHQIKHSNSKQFKCNQTDCCAEYKFSGSLREHQLREHPALVDTIPIMARSGRNRFKCDINGCHFVTKLFGKLRRHKRTEHIVNPYVCAVCGKGFAEKYLLTKHIQRFKGLQTFVCELDSCGQVFHSSKLLDRHVTVVHDSNALKCHLSGCDKQFRNADTLRRHKLTHDLDQNAKYVCDWSQCSKRFLRKEGLAAHRRTHTGEKPFGCEWPGCERRFAQENNLYSHRLLHQIERKYHCVYPECKYKTNCKFSLKRHTSVHTGERPYQCEWPGCEFRTAFQHNLKIHRIKVHKV